ncbi:MAG: hypothetical protein IPF98_23600 [Gemmatimonadetes bacterium]|nr:hypothetical protein [Gemmatimonadota bacterium]
MLASLADAKQIFVSAASAWEVSTKHRIGKLPGAGPLAVDFAREVRQQGFAELPISLTHGQVAGALSGEPPPDIPGEWGTAPESSLRASALGSQWS